MFPRAAFGFRSDWNGVDYQSSSRRRRIAMCTADNIKLAECLDRFTLQAHGFNMILYGWLHYAG